ncbi:hypothetical protein B0H10DRAFT_2211315 [Mycena sp. CBHHK59/15]|nr:hypothetical protein B0H10DRAFT_2211315 [Mycena sp. CBHHK59/15]
MYNFIPEPISEYLPDSSSDSEEAVVVGKGSAKDCTIPEVVADIDNQKATITASAPARTSHPAWVEEVEDQDLISFDLLAASGEGTSRKKGKDLKAQQDALANFAEINRIVKTERIDSQAPWLAPMTPKLVKGERPTQIYRRLRLQRPDMWDSPSRTTLKTRGVTPGRLAAGSFLAKAMQGTGRDPLPSDSWSSSSSSSPSSHDSSSSSDDESSNSEQSTSRRCRRVSSRREHGWEHKEVKMLLKPIPPSWYNGEPSANLLYRLVRGKDLFAAHIAEWSQIYNTIGIDDGQEKVVKLFNSFNFNIQTESYRKDLDPEVATWDEVVKGAEAAEMLVKIDAKNRAAGAAAVLAQQQSASRNASQKNAETHHSCRGQRGLGQGAGGREDSRSASTSVQTSSVEVPTAESNSSGSGI